MKMLPLLCLIPTLALAKPDVREMCLEQRGVATHDDAYEAMKTWPQPQYAFMPNQFGTWFWANRNGDGEPTKDVAFVMTFLFRDEQFLLSGCEECRMVPTTGPDGQPTWTWGECRAFPSGVKPEPVLQ